MQYEKQSGTLSRRTEVLTPKRAQSYLATMIKNRHPRPNKVKAYAQDIIDGHWEQVGDPIRFNKSGKMIDGQHRCLAVIAAQKPIRVDVVRGIDDEALHAIDGGITRSPSDVLGLHGYTSNVLVAATARQLNWLRHSQPSHSESYKARAKLGLESKAMLLRFVEENMPMIGDGVRLITKLKPEMPPKFVPNGLLVAFWMEFARVDECDGQFATEFIESLMTGVDLKKDSPIYKARARLLKSVTDSQKLNRIGMTSAIIRAWNYWVTGTPLTWLVLGKRPAQTDSHLIPAIIGPSDTIGKMKSRRTRTNQIAAAKKKKKRRGPAVKVKKTSTKTVTTMSDLADTIGVSRAAIYSWKRRANDFPEKVNGSYDVAAVASWVERNKG